MMKFKIGDWVMASKAVKFQYVNDLRLPQRYDPKFNVGQVVGIKTSYLGQTDGNEFKKEKALELYKVLYGWTNRPLLCFEEDLIHTSDHPQDLPYRKVFSDEEIKERKDKMHAKRDKKTGRFVS